MKLIKHITVLMMILLPFAATAQPFLIKGKVVDADSKLGLEYAAIYIDAIEKGAITNIDGKFEITGIPKGKLSIRVSILGYAERTILLNIENNYPSLVISMSKYDLLLDDVVVTAKQETQGATTKYNINSTALEHEQITNISDIQALLPGGKSPIESNLATDDSPFIIQGESSGEIGNPAFGTAVDVDGVRLQNNAVANQTTGVDTRNISSLNIESVEVITGIPSVEYGDLTNGLVRIKTKKGVTPFAASLTLNPNTKQIGISKGFDLGDKRGILNASIEHTKSFTDIASPYTAYDRNALGLNYYIPFNNNLSLSTGLSGNIGGYDSENDPDMFSDTYTKQKDNSLRANLNIDWDLDKSWISSIHFTGSANYRNLLNETRTNKSSASTQAAVHATEDGYHIAVDYDEDPDAPVILLPTGYWYEDYYYDNKPRDYNAKLKADWAKVWSHFQTRLMLGAEYNNSANSGRGAYYGDLRYAPSWREYKLSDIPQMNNLALYIEKSISKNFKNNARVNLAVGFRSDNTFVGESEYGRVSSGSPRFNLSYKQKYKRTSFIKSINAYAGWGRAVKLPSFAVLYPETSYVDRLAFASGSTSDNTSYTAYYTYGNTPTYNPDLEWQYADKAEIGLGIDFGFADLKLSAYHSILNNAYTTDNIYTPYAYKLTTQSDIEGSLIALDDRQYTIDQETGIVTIHDASGTYESYELSYTERKIQTSSSTPVNGSPAKRFSLDWIIDFKQINAIKTSFRIDGNYYRYRGVNELLQASSASSSLNMTNGQPYSYVGYYIGGASSANGRLSKKLNANFTAITHIPKIRMIITLRVEASLMDYTQSLSEYSGGDRGFIIDDLTDFEGTDTDIYNRNEFVAFYPEYYSSWDNPDERIPFEEKFLWAKENDPDLYNDLSELVVKSNRKYTFDENKISPYFSANINITKEIGEIASLSFFARNFTHNMRTVNASASDLEGSLYDSSYIPDFYYGLTMRLKL